MYRSLMMTDFHRYLPPPARPGPWGLDLRAGGRALIVPHGPYPHPGHPAGFDFAWDHGRWLRQFALVLITHGGGVFIDHHRQHHAVAAGQAFLIVPGHWHTYRPDGDSGWGESWLVFDGPAARRLLEPYLAGDLPLVLDADTGLSSAIVSALILLQHQPAGFLAEAEACLAQALARVVAVRSASAEDPHHGAAMRQAATRLQEGPACIATLARDAGLSEAQFRRCFRAVTGHSPRDYAVLVRLERAKALLSSPDATVAAVAERTGFSSASFFSRMFTRHCGCPPQTWQRRRCGGPSTGPRRRDD